MLHNPYTPNIYEWDIVECFDIVAVQIKITKEKKPNLTKLTKKMIENGGL